MYVCMYVVEWLSMLYSSQPNEYRLNRTAKATYEHHTLALCSNAGQEDFSVIGSFDSHENDVSYFLVYIY